MVSESEKALANQEYEKVESFAASALEACKDILSESKKSIERPAGFFLSRGDVLIIGISITIILSVIALKILSDFIKTRKPKRSNYKKKKKK